MVLASQLRTGMAIRYEGQLYRVLAAEYHPGQGRMTGANHARLRNLSTGTLWEHSFRSELKLDDIPMEKRALEFLYADADQCCFMNPETYEQVEIPRTLLGPQASFLESGMRLAVEFIEGRPVNVVLPDHIEVRIAETAPASHQQQDSNFKAAKLDNGVEVMVPQFVKSGDMIRMDVQTMKYVDRVRRTPGVGAL
jgi:elongation factor P